MCPIRTRPQVSEAANVGAGEPGPAAACPGKTANAVDAQRRSGREQATVGQPVTPPPLLSERMRRGSLQHDN
jgi:hypothetical protein